MKSNQRPSLKDRVLPPLGRKVFKLILFLLGFGVSLLVFDVVYLRQNCKPSDQQDKITCVSSDIATQFYASFLTAALSIWGIELVLREETLKDIEQIVGLSQAVKGIEAFYHDKNYYHQSIADKITNLKAGETIKMLLLSEEVEILGLIGEQKIKEKLRIQCHFQILLVDPNSILINCIDNVSSKNRKSSIQGQISNFCQAFNQRLTYSSTPEKMITGSLEIRFHKDVFSSFCYLSGEEMKIVWMYFFDSEGSLQYPGFRFSETNQKLIQAAEAHFDKLWSISDDKTQIALRLNRDYPTDPYINKYDPQTENISQV